MESTNREQYKKIEKDINRVKSEITGDKSKEEILALVEEKEKLVASLEAELFRAEDSAREDDANLDDAREQIETLTTEIGQYKDQIAEITGLAEEDRETSHLSPELAETLAETLARLRNAGYLDTSFEGKEVHELAIRPLTKKEALAEYKDEKNGGKAWVWEMERDMPYNVPKAENLEVMIMNFGKNIESQDALDEMDKLGVRTLTYEELIQYGIANPEHQKLKVLVSLGSKDTLGGGPRAPSLGFGGGGRLLSADLWGGGWGGGYRFPVVRK